MGVIRDLPADCQRIIIVGAGGFGREVLHWATDAWPEHRGKIAGFLSNDPGVLENKNCPLSIIGSPEDFEPLPGDYLVLAIGIPGARRTVTEGLLARGCRFLTLIHPTAVIAPTAVIEEGAVICPYAIASDAVRVSRFALLNYHASLGHDAAVGDFTVLSPYATLGGYAEAAEDVFLGIHSAVGPRSRIGARSKVSATSSLLVQAPSDSIVFGSPGRVLPRLSISST